MSRTSIAPQVPSKQLVGEVNELPLAVSSLHLPVHFTAVSTAMCHLVALVSAVCLALALLSPLMCPVCRGCVVADCCVQVLSGESLQLDFVDFSLGDLCFVLSERTL